MFPTSVSASGGSNGDQSLYVCMAYEVQHNSSESVVNAFPDFSDLQKMFPAKHLLKCAGVQPLLVNVFCHSCGEAVWEDGTDPGSDPFRYTQELDSRKRHHSDHLSQGLLFWLIKEGFRVSLGTVNGYRGSYATDFDSSEMASI